MAFHAFRIFRKRKKVMFAGLTILCMISFVFCAGFGKSDFGQWLGLMFTGSGKSLTNTQGKPLTLYRKKVTAEGLSNVREEWITVVAYLTSLETHYDIVGKWEAVRTRSPEEKQIFIERLRFCRAEWCGYRETRRTMMPKSRTRHGGWVSKWEKNNVKIYRKKYLWKTFLDYIIWRHQADVLDIRLTREDMVTEMAKEGVYIDVAQIGSVIQQLGMRGWTPDRLCDALKDWARIEIAQRSLEGAYRRYQGGVNPVPDAFAPFDFWEYYRDKLTSVDVALVPVPVEPFRSQVQEKPGDKRLLALFDRYKDQEQTPTRSQPGFKEPARVGIAWVAGQPESPYYRRTSHNVMLSQMAATRLTRSRPHP